MPQHQQFSDVSRDFWGILPVSKITRFNITRKPPPHPYGGDLGA